MMRNLLRITGILCIAVIQSTLYAQHNGTECSPASAVPYSITQSSLTVWNGSGYSPIFVKGVNLGVSVPGTYPGELAATRQQYIRWIQKIRETGFNCIRTYTLHFPVFYEVLDSFNLAHPNDPLLLMQGIWLDEGDSTYQNDLYSLTRGFDTAIEQVVDCMHGNLTIPPRPGQAYGTFSKDVSRWVLAYVIGREVHPGEVLTTNANHAADTAFSGQALSIHNASPSETWITKRLDLSIIRERSIYHVERPVTFSSWPTLDPIKHPTEIGTEDTASVSLAKIDFSKAPGGIFATYHAYPYYPDFISNDPGYQTYTDYMGPNSYVGYLTDLKSRYPRFPLIIAENGTPSSWGIAHYSQSGMNHGGFDEQEQGLNFIRLLDNIASTECGGGISFAWIDEWFKRTWIVDPLDNDRRVLWHNVTSAEQNFGLIGFRKNPVTYLDWGSFPAQCSISHIDAAADYEFFHTRVGIRESLGNLDTIWIALDTYAPALGESILPDGHTVSNRAEFALRITNYSAELYVTRAYDLFGIWHGVSQPYQLYHSVPTDGAPWDLIRWKNADPEHDIQYIGVMKVRRVEMPPSSRDAVVISDTSLDIRIPWTLLQFSDPSSLSVINDNRQTPSREDTVTDGISLTVFHDGCSATPPTRFTWQGWNSVTGIEEYEKADLQVMREKLPLVATSPFSLCDEYTAKRNVTLHTDAPGGVLNNDFDPSGGSLQAELTTTPSHGFLTFSGDGSFDYLSFPDFSGTDIFSYRVYNGYAHSDTSRVYIQVLNNAATGESPADHFRLYPNPVHDVVTLDLPKAGITYGLRISSLSGSVLYTGSLCGESAQIDVTFLNPGVYLLSLFAENTYVSRKLCIY